MIEAVEKIINETDIYCVKFIMLADGTLQCSCYLSSFKPYKNIGILQKYKNFIQKQLGSDYKFYGISLWRSPKLIFLKKLKEDDNNDCNR